MDKPNEIGDGPRLTNKQGRRTLYDKKLMEADRKRIPQIDKGDFKNGASMLFIDNADTKCYAQGDCCVHKPRDKKNHGCGS